MWRVCQLFHIFVQVLGLRCTIMSCHFWSCLDRGLFGVSETLASHRSIWQYCRCAPNVSAWMEARYWLCYRIFSRYSTWKCPTRFGKVCIDIFLSADDVQDVSWRYVNNHKEILLKRTKCSENDLLQTITLLRNKRRVKLSPVRCTYLNKRSMIELVELMTPREVTENERKGRSSGSLNWKLSRGEQNVNNVWL